MDGVQETMRVVDGFNIGAVDGDDGLVMGAAAEATPQVGDCPLDAGNVVRPPLDGASSGDELAHSQRRRRWCSGRRSARRL